MQNTATSHFSIANQGRQHSTTSKSFSNLPLQKNPKAMGVSPQQQNQGRIIADQLNSSQNFKSLDNMSNISHSVFSVQNQYVNPLKKASPVPPLSLKGPQKPASVLNTADDYYKLHK